MIEARLGRCACKFSGEHSILLGAYVHPVDELLKWLPAVDFAVLEQARKSLC